MTPHHRHPLGIALRIVTAAACCLGIWYSWNLARADYLFQQDTEDSVRAAIALVPDGWEYYMRLAVLDRPHARQLLMTSLRLDPYNAQADIELALQYEADGDIDQAEKLMLQAYNIDHTYLPRWSLANFYFRRDNMKEFWAWARSAAAMPPENIAPLFQLCWHATTDADKITAELLNDKPELLRQYLPFLLRKDQVNAITVVAPRLVNFGDSAAPTDRNLAFWALARLIEINDAPAANALWHTLVEHHWVVADNTIPNNPEFAREPAGTGFDWSLPEYPGLHSWPGSSGLEAEFTGDEPEYAIITEQFVTLAAGSYNLAYSYHTTDIAPGTGIKWQVIDAKSAAVLAESADLSSDTLAQANLAFTVPQGASFVRLRLTYQRALGTPRVTGMLILVSAHVLPQA